MKSGTEQMVRTAASIPHVRGWLG